MSDELVVCKGVVKYYGKTQALKGIDLQLQQGRIVGLLGPNGSGKTTLIKLLSGLLQPTEGTVTIGGHPVGPESKALVSYLPDQLCFPLWMRPIDLVNTYSDFFADFDRGHALRMLNALEIDSRAQLKTMSKGTKEKVQLVMAMARKARLYLLDEPIAGVDPAAREFILRTILANYNPEGTVLLSTHLISDVEQILDDAVFIRNGSVVLNSSVDDIREEKGCSVDELFRKVFQVNIHEGGTVTCLEN